MDNLTRNVADVLLNGRSVVLVGCVDSGKTHWALRKLIPFLRQQKKNVVYFEGGEHIKNISGDIFIFDEAETMFDRHFLEEKHSAEQSYYTAEYFESVLRWHGLYKKFPNASLFIITRNFDEDIDNLVKNFKKTDWDGRNIITVPFEKHYIFACTS